MYLKTIEKSKAFAATLSDIEPENDFDNEDDKILKIGRASCRERVFNWV